MTVDNVDLMASGKRESDERPDFYELMREWARALLVANCEDRKTAKEVVTKFKSAEKFREQHDKGRFGEAMWPLVGDGFRGRFVSVVSRFVTACMTIGETELAAIAWKWAQDCARDSWYQKKGTNHAFAFRAAEAPEYAKLFVGGLPAVATSITAARRCARAEVRDLDGAGLRSAALVIHNALASAPDLQLHLRTGESKRPQRQAVASRHQAAGELKRQASRRGPISVGRVFLSDAVLKYGVPKTTLHRWVRQSRTCDAMTDDVSKQIHLDKSCLVALLQRKGIEVAK
jgi:hypothetical protein